MSECLQKMALNGEDYPEWLNSLGGDYPLLEYSEWEYIAEVRNRIIRETKTMPSLPSDKILKKKLSIMKENFVYVVKYLRENSQTKEYFVSTYPAWRNVRNLTVLQLKEIAKSVDQDSQNCSLSRGVGSSVSLLGGLICLLSGSGSSRVMGSVWMGLGSMTSAGTSAVELDLLRRKIKEAEKIIQEDREYSEKLWKWMSDASFIQEALNAIRYIDVDFNLVKAANHLHASHKNKSNSAEIQKVIGTIMKSLKISPAITKEVSEVVCILMSISMLYERYRPLFNRAFEAFKYKKVFNAAYDMIITTIKVNSAVNVGKSSELTNVQKSQIFTGIALDAINVILISDSVISKSKEAKEIFKAAEKLEEEAAIFEKLYYAMNCL